MSNLIFIFILIFLASGDIQADDTPIYFDQPPQQTTEKLQSEIEKTSEEIHAQLNESTADDQEVHVILIPLHRTILSNQISTPILSSQVSSIVRKIYKRMGEYFEEGELLIKIDDAIFRANLDKARAALARARALLRTREALFRDNIISFLDLKEAEAVAASAEAEYVLADTQFEGAFVIAPYRGRVIAVMIEEFELPQPGQALIEIEQTDKLLAKVFFPSIFYNDLNIGKTIEIRVKETETTVTATIIRTGGAIDPSSSTIAVEAEIDNYNGDLMAGMTGITSTANLKTKKNEDVQDQPKTDTLGTQNPELNDPKIELNDLEGDLQDPSKIDTSGTQNPELNDLGVYDSQTTDGPLPAGEEPSPDCTTVSSDKPADD